MSDIFISYKREEQATARKFANALESEGWTVWWDPKLRAGEHFDDVIEKALNEAKCVIVLWSNRSVKSRYIKDEATYALDHNKLVPVTIENVTLPFRFRGLHTLSLIGWDGSKDSPEFRRLVEDISAILNPLVLVVERAKPAEIQQSIGKNSEEKYVYSAEARADVDFPLSDRSKVTRIITALKTYDYYKQSPAIEAIFSLDWTEVTPDEAFVLGRNIYQCACGKERKAEAVFGNIRGTLARLPLNIAEHLVNGMFYEVYFDAKGKFRGPSLKGRYLAELLSIQTVDKYKNCISFIRHALAPYRGSLGIVPSTTPEVVDVKLEIEMKASPIVTSIQCFGKEVLVDASSDFGLSARISALSFRIFSLQTLTDAISEAWHVPREQLRLKTSTTISQDVKLNLPEGKTIGRPFD